MASYEQRRTTEDCAIESPPFGISLYVVFFKLRKKWGDMMWDNKNFCRGPVFGIILVFCALLAACGGGSSGNAGPAPSISINVPTSAVSYPTTSSSVRLGGTISHASYVHVRNALTGSTAEGYVNYYQGNGAWFADVYGLGLGDNLITVTADADGTGARTATANITVTRPLQPVDLIINGSNQLTASAFWTDTSSFSGSHKIAFFGDGTGRSTTGSTVTENAGAVVNFTWSKQDPDSIVITNCLDCSFQKIFRIEGSLNEGIFYGQVVTIGNAGYISMDSFTLTSGSL